MRIFALDIATVTGFADGIAGEIPASGSVRLKGRKDGPDVAAFNMGAFLRDRWALQRPDILAIEHYLHPLAQKSGDAVILQLFCHGVAISEAMRRDIPIHMPKAATIRKHFLGRSNMGERQATKDAVIKRARLLGYIPRDCVDDNRADAAALWDWACAHVARVQPAELVMFMEAAR